MQNSSKDSDTGKSRYAYPRVKTNRHKVNKVSAVSDDHLYGRHRILVLDLEELAGRWPSICQAIEAEMEMISKEVDLRSRGGRKPPKPVVQEPTPEWEDPDSLFELEHTEMLEVDECEN